MISRSQTHTAEHGFTLLELMLSVGLLGLLVVMLYASFRAVVESKLHAEDRLNAEQQGRNVIWQMSREIRGMVQTPLVQSNTLLLGQGHTQSSHPLDTMTFSTLYVAHRRSLTSFGTEELVSYTTVPTRRHPGWFTLLRGQTSALIPLGAGASATAPLALADNVLSLHLRYFDGVRWVESWDSRGAVAGQVLPQAISLDLTLAGPRGRPVSFSTLVSVPMAFTLR